MDHRIDPHHIAVESVRQPLSFLVCALAMLVGSLPAAAEGPSPAPVQLSFVNPIQLVAEARSIRGARISVLRGANEDVTGFDLSGVASVTNGSLRGFQLSIANEVGGGVSGAQIGVFMNHVGGDLQGVQLAGVTARVSGGAGVQIAPIFADAVTFRGFQFGIVTRAEEMRGLQIGLLNFNKKGFLPVFPIFNFGS